MTNCVPPVPEITQKTLKNIIKEIIFKPIKSKACSMAVMMLKIEKLKTNHGFLILNIEQLASYITFISKLLGSKTYIQI